jgi:hypothetical protein
VICSYFFFAVDIHDKSTTIVRTVRYHGVLLSEKSRKELIALFPVEDGWRAHAHHMTIALNAYEPREGVPPLGSEAELRIVAFGKSAKACAVQVSGVASQNKIAHITLAVSPSGKPVDSNFIAEWEQLPADHPASSLVLHGVVAEVANYNLAQEKKPKPRVNPAAMVKKVRPELGAKIPAAAEQLKQWIADAPQEPSDEEITQFLHDLKL